MKRFAISTLAALAAAASMSTAQAARYQLTYTDTFNETQWNPVFSVLDSQTSTLTAYFDGTLLGDNDSIQINSWEAGATLDFNGNIKTLPALPQFSANDRLSLSGNVCKVFAEDGPSSDHYFYCTTNGAPTLSIWNVNLEYIASYEAVNMSISLAPAPVPEPSTALLALLGVPALLAGRRKKA